MKNTFEDKYEQYFDKCKDTIFICPICKRETPPQFREKHHLVPKAKKGKETVILCRNCGDQLHKLFTNQELTKKFNTIESILANEDVQRWIQWISKKTGDFSVCMASKKRR